MSKSISSILVTFFFLVSFCNNTNAQVDIRKSKVYTTVDRMPCFVECGNNLPEEKRRACCEEQVKNFMLDHLEYPIAAKRANLEGSVIIQFVVDRNGTVIDPKIISDLGKGCGEEALRVVNMMPRWETPGMQANKKVAVQFDLPIRFSMEEMNRPRGKTTAKDIATAAVILGGFFLIAKKMREKEKNKKKNRRRD